MHIKDFYLKIKEKKFEIYIVLIALLLFSILIYRVNSMPITYDEAYTYVNYVKTDFKGIIRPLVTKGTILANNHYLNSFLISMVDLITGIKYNEFLIRLPNIFFYFVYLLFSYKVSNKYKHKYLIFNLLVFNYGVHEFFGLARGYGMACALTLIGMYFLKLWLEDIKSYGNLNICYYALLLSCFANSVALIGFASVIIFSQLYILICSGIKENFNYVKTQFLKILPIFPALAVIIRYHFRISREGLPLYGGNNGFLNSVLVSGLELYGINNKISLFITFLLLISLVVLIILKRKQVCKFGPYYLIVFYFVLLIIMTKVFNKPWITGRELIPSYPIILLSIYELVDAIEFKFKFVYVLATIIVALPFLLNLDFHKTRLWKGDFETRNKLYDVYYNKKKIKYNEQKDSYSYQFYRDKILYYHNYDIFYKSK